MTLPDPEFETRLFTGRDLVLLMDLVEVGRGATIDLVRSYEARQERDPEIYAALEGPEVQRLRTVGERCRQAIHDLTVARERNARLRDDLHALRVRYFQVQNRGD